MGTFHQTMSALLKLAAVIVAVASALPVNPTCTGVLMLGVFKKNGAAGVTNRVIEDKIGAPSKLTWGHVSRSSFACTDGRWQMSSMYTPGSDIGEFILAVNAANKMKKPEDKLTSAAIKQHLTAYLEKTQKAVVGMCGTQTTTDAMERIIRNNANVSVDSAMPSMNAELATQSAMEMASDSAMGDRFLKELLTRPDVYQTPVEVTKDVLKAFFSIMFQGNSVASQKLHVYSLTGVNEPAAFVDVQESKRCNNAGVAPLLKAAAGDSGNQVLYNSQDAVKLFRSDLAQFFQEQNVGVDAEDMMAEMKRIGDTQLKEFISTFGSIPSFLAQIK